MGPHDGNGAFVAAAEAYLHLYGNPNHLPLGAEGSGDGAQVAMAALPGPRETLWSRQPLDAATFQLQHVASGSCLQVAASATGLATCTGEGAQAFYLRMDSTPGAAPGGVQLVTSQGQCLLPGALVGAPVAVTACPATSGWRVLPWVAGGGAGATWTGIIGTGQSLSVGYLGRPVVSLAAAATSLSLKVLDPQGLYATDENAQAGWVVAPLSEPLRPFPGAGVDDVYPHNIQGESGHGAMAEQLHALAMGSGQGGMVTAHSVVGRGAQPMSVIEKGGTGNNFAAAMAETRAFAALAAAGGRFFAVGATVLTHGEADVCNPNYAAQVVQLSDDLRAGVVAITGQASAPIMLLSQQNSCPNVGGPPLSTLAVLEGARLRPDEIYVIGPRYPYPYAEGLHLVAGGYRRLGHKTAEVYWRITQNQEAWRPLEVTQVELTTPTQLRLSFHVPDPPLVWDDSCPAVHQSDNTAWALGRGFEVTDGASAPVPIADVSIGGSGDQVLIHLGQAVQRPLTVAYAITADGTDGAYHAGSALGRGGALRDSDPFVAIDRATLSCQVQAGSTRLTCPSGLDQRTVSDLVEEASAAVVDLPSPTTAVLSAPWMGPSSTLPLTFRANHANYLVAFVWPVT